MQNAGVATPCSGVVLLGLGSWLEEVERYVFVMVLNHSSKSRTTHCIIKSGVLLQ